MKQSRDGKRPFKLWIPLLPIWLLLLPVALLLLPVVFVVFLFIRLNPFRATSLYWQLYRGFLGAKVAIENPEFSIRIL